MIIDSHCHLHDDRYHNDLEEVLLRAQEAKVTHMISIGCDLPTTEAAKNLAERYRQIFFTAGFHPHDAKLLDDAAYEKIKQLASHERCVAVGEIGLDYYYLHSTKEEQLNAFKRQLDCATFLNLPVVIHLRDAFDDCITVLKNYSQLTKGRIVIHCFSGSLEEAKLFESLGCLISLSGIITFKKPGALRDVAREMRLTTLLIETDSPYLSPEPHRGKRNEPKFVKSVLAAVADARGEDVSAVAEAIYENTIKFFNLPT